MKQPITNSANGVDVTASLGWPVWFTVSFNGRNMSNMQRSEAEALLWCLRQTLDQAAKRDEGA